MRLTIKRFISLMALVGLAMAITPRGRAQRLPAAESAVYVHDSGVAVEKLALAEKLERLKEWDRSADLYLEVARDFSDRVIAVDGDDRRYVNIVRVVQQRLAKWPAEGVAAFRSRFESVAAAAVASAGHDHSALSQVLSQYLLTDAAKKAGLTLVDDELEAGNFTSARDTAKDLIDQHPALTDDDRAQLFLRLGIAARLSGDEAAAKAAFTSLGKQSGATVISINGKDISIADAIDLFAKSPTTHPSYLEDRWLTPMGSAARSRTATRIQFGGTRMGYRDLEATAPRGVAKAQLEALQKQQELARPAGFSTGIFPVMDRGELFFQDNARIYAADVVSGETLPGWLKTYPQSGTYTLPDAWALPQGLPCLLTLTDDSVFATMGLMDYNAAMYAGMVSAHSTRLVSVNRIDGRPRWSVLSQQLPENLSSLDFAGCPLVDSTTVYVQAHGSHGSFDDAYLLAFDRADGSFRWSCYLCSSNLGTPDIDPTANPFPVATTIAAESGRLFVQTNNGAIACVDSGSGSTLWLSEYPRDAVVMDRNDPAIWSARRLALLGPRRPWEHNSAIASGGKIFAMPDDTSSLFVYDQSGGSLLRRVLLSDYDGARTLIGVVGDHAIFCSGKRLFCIDWTRYPSSVKNDAAAAGDSPPDRAKEAIVWISDLKRTDMPEDAIRGRGVVAGDSVIIPTARQLLRFSVAGGSLRQAFPILPENKWREDEGPGNLLFVGEQMVVAGVTGSGVERVSWYTDFELARRRLEAAEALEPKRVEPLLRSARALFTAGQASTARQKLQAAMVLAPADKSDSLQKAKIYASAIDLARRAAADTHSDPALAADFFDQASPYVEGAERQVEYRLIRGDYDKQHANVSGMIAMYQQILTQPLWRSVNLLQGDRMTTAGDLAAETIGSVRDSTSGSYDEVEKTAQAAFGNAQASRGVEQLVEVGRAYPNSSVVGKAYTAAANQAQFAGDDRRAVQLLRLALGSATETSDRLQLLQQMAQSYLQLPGGVRLAAGRLRQASRLSPTAKLSMSIALPNGRTLADLSYAEAARQIDAEAALHVAPLPDCGIPTNVRLPGAARKRITPFTTVELDQLGDRINSLLDAPDGSSRIDRLVGKTSDGVLVLRPGDTAPLFRVKDLPHVIQAAWAGGGLALLESSTITLVAGDTGQRHWQKQLGDIAPPSRLVVAAAESTATTVDDLDGNFGTGVGWANPAAVMRARRRGVPLEEVSENAEIFSSLAVLADRLICSTNRGRVLAFELGQGTLLWQRQLSDRAVIRLLASDDFVIAQTREAGSTPFVIDTYDGQVLHGNENVVLGADFRVLNIALASDGLLVMTGPTTLVIKDLFEAGTLMQSTFRFPPNAIAVTVYNPTDPQSVQIQGRRVYALTDGGMKLRVVSLDDGRAVMFNQAQSVDTGARAGASLEMLADEQHCYVANDNWVHGYDLTRGSHWGEIDTPQIRDIALTTDHVIAMAGHPSGDEEMKTGQDELQLFSRAADPQGAESGLLDFRYPLPKGFMAAEWQVVDGGVYLLGQNHRLIWLAGSVTH